MTLDTRMHVHRDRIIEWHVRLYFDLFFVSTMDNQENLQSPTNEPEGDVKDNTSPPKGIKKVIRLNQTDIYS